MSTLDTSVGFYLGLVLQETKKEIFESTLWIPTKKSNLDAPQWIPAQKHKYDR